jgi:hypothetical protein
MQTAFPVWIVRPEEFQRFRCFVVILAFHSCRSTAFRLHRGSHREWFVRRTSSRHERECAKPLKVEKAARQLGDLFFKGE